MIIGITGMPGSGKAEIRKIIEEMDIPVVIMREVVQKEMEQKGISINNRTLRNYSTELRKKHGMDVVAKKCKPLVEKSLKTNKIIALDGIRGLEEIEYFKKFYTDDFILISVHASPKTRFERLKERGEKWDMKEWDEFVWRDKQELSWGIGNAIAESDYIIVNEGTIQELKENFKDVYDKIIRNQG